MWSQNRRGQERTVLSASIGPSSCSFTTPKTILGVVSVACTAAMFTCEVRCTTRRHWQCCSCTTASRHSVSKSMARRVLQRCESFAITAVRREALRPAPEDRSSTAYMLGRDAAECALGWTSLVSSRAPRTVAATQGNCRVGGGSRHNPARRSLFQHKEPAPAHRLSGF